MSRLTEYPPKNIPRDNNVRLAKSGKVYVGTGKYGEPVLVYPDGTVEGSALGNKTGRWATDLPRAVRARDKANAVEKQTAESLVPEAHFVTTAFRWSDLKGENRRFMFDGKRMLLGIAKGSPTEGSHAVEWRNVTGSNAGFDNAVRGWVGIGGRSKNGVIHFAPPIKAAHMEAFDKAFDALRWFESRGAGPKTTVRGFEGAWEQLLSAVVSVVKEAVMQEARDFIFPAIPRNAPLVAHPLFESRLSQVEYDVARLKQPGDIEKVRSMLAAGIGSTRVAKDMPRLSGSWAWFEVFDARDGLNGERIPGVVFYAPVGLTPSQFGSAARKALQRSLGESADAIVAQIDSLLAVLT